MFTSCVQTVFHQQPHTLKVSFAMLQLLYQLCDLAILLASVNLCAWCF